MGRHTACQAKVVRAVLANAQRFFWRLEHGEEVATPPPPQESENDKIQADPVASVKEKAESYFWEVLARVQGFLEELQEDGDFVNGGGNASQGWYRIRNLDFTPPSDAARYYPPSVFSRDEPRRHEFADNSVGWKSEFYITLEPLGASGAELATAAAAFSWEQLEAFSEGAEGANLDKNALVAWFETSFKAGVFGFELVGESPLSFTSATPLVSVSVGEFVFVVGGGSFGAAEESDAYGTYSEFASPVAKSAELKDFDFNQI